MLGGFKPRLADIFSLPFSGLVNAMSANNIRETQIMIVFISHVAKESFPNAGFVWQVFLQTFSQKFLDRNLKVAEGECPHNSFFRARQESTFACLHWGPFPLAGNDCFVGVGEFHSAQETQKSSVSCVKLKISA